MKIIKVKKVFIKTFFISFTFWYSLFATALPVVVVAQEVEEPIGEVTEETVTVETGDAGSSATAVGDANDSETQVEGSLEGGTCDTPSTGCPGDTTVGTTQEADTTTTSDAESTTGENEVETDVNAELTTGSATSRADTLAEANSNEVALEEGESGQGEKQEDLGTEGESSEENSELNVITDQTATADAKAESESDTGENEVDAQKDAEATTGDAAAIANVINIANLNLVGSDLVVLTQDILGEYAGDFNFYQILFDILLKLQNEGVEKIPQDVLIETVQEAALSTDASATSDTGENNIKGETVNAETGDALAVANGVSLANINLVGTNGVFTVFNIMGSLLGDIIMPNLYYLSPADFPWGNVYVENNQNAQVNSSSLAESNSGANNLEGEVAATTGNAGAIANNYSFANLVRVGDGWMLLIFNLFGNWEGSIKNVDSPGSSQTLGAPGTYVYEGEESLEQNSGSGVEGGSLTVKTTQSAFLDSQVLAGSNTGKNNIQGNGSLKTGNAFSLANSFSLANFVGIGGSIVFGIFNIVGNWFGDFILAYPDLAISITDDTDQVSAGSPHGYNVVVENRGKAHARDVGIGITLPADFQADSSEFGDVGDIAPGETKSFSIGGTILPTALANSELVASATVGSSDTEEDTTNNSSSDKTLVVVPQVQSHQPDSTLPQMQVTIKNNVGEFVYPGDTVLAEIAVTNQSGVLAHDVEVYGALFNDHPMPELPMYWELGNMAPGERVIIGFAIELIDELPAGEYHLEVEAYGKSEVGEEVASPIARSNFNVFLKYLADTLGSEAQAAEDKKQEGEVLGANSSADEKLGLDYEKYFPYIFITSVLAYLALSSAKRKLNGEPIFPAFLKRNKK